MFWNKTYHFCGTWRQSHEKKFSDLDEYSFSGPKFVIFCYLLRFRFIWMYSHLRMTCSSSSFDILKSKFLEIIVCFDFYERLRELTISIGTPVKHHWRGINVIKSSLWSSKLSCGVSIDSSAHLDFKYMLFKMISGFFLPFFSNHM